LQAYLKGISLLARISALQKNKAFLNMLSRTFLIALIFASAEAKIPNQLSGKFT